MTFSSRRGPAWPTLFAVFAMCAVVNPAFTQPAGKAAAPVVPGFTRFYANADSDAAKGGHLLFAELNCARCHAPRDANDADKNAKPAPVLDGIGARVKRSYLKRFLSDPHATKPGTKMPDLFAGLDDAEKKANVEALTHFLASSGTPATMRPDRKGINAGRDLYAQVGCVACHGTRDGKGDQDKLFATSVPLGDLKAKYTLAGLKTFLENPHQTRPSGRMPGILTAKEAGDVANYLLQGSVPGLAATNMKYAYYEGAWQKLPDFAKLKPVAQGEAAEFELSVARRGNNCGLRFEGYLRIENPGEYTFFTVSDDGSKLWIDDQLVVNNDGIHPPQTQSGKIKLAKGAHKIVLGVFNLGGGFELRVDFQGPGMGRQALGPRIEMSAEKAKPAPAVKGDPENFPLQADLIKKGKELFASVGCANCHQMQNESRRVNAIAEANLKLDGGCLAAAPKKGTPWFALSAAQQKSLRAGLAKPANAKKNDLPEIVKSTLIAFNCCACHERDKFGGVEDDVNKLFLTVMPEMGDEGRIPPSLTGVGAKLNTAYLAKILQQGSHDRPYMHTRMPKFGANVGHLPDLFASIDTPEKGPKVTLDGPATKFKAAARHMVGGQAFGCIKCHTFAGKKAEGVQGIDLAIMTQRLKKDWFHNYMLNPTKYRPGTRMPASFPDGQTTLSKVLDGKADTQIEAIWFYLTDGTGATIPFGMDKKSIPLIPVTEAIIYRNFIQGAGPRAIGVGFPERAHLAFDANDMRIAMIWQGGFIDAGRHWNDRGVGFQVPMGDNIMNLPPGPAFFILGKPDEAWPNNPSKQLGYRFKGYRLTDDQRPTFLYSFNEIQIEDAPNAIETKAGPTLKRTLTISTDNPIDKLYYRAAVADKIEADKDGWFRVDAWRTRIDSAAVPVIRRAGNKMELLVPIPFKGNSAKVVQEYVW